MNKYFDRGGAVFGFCVGVRDADGPAILRFTCVCVLCKCGAVWCSVVQCGAVWCSVVLRGAGVVQCGAGVVQVWCWVVQCGAV